MSAPRRTASVVLVDDEPDLRFLVDKILVRSGFELLGTAEDGLAGVELVAREQPDVVLLDLAMPRLGGQEALPQILREAPATMVAILSAHLNTDRARGLLTAGAFAAYDKGDLARLPALVDEDLDTFRRVIEGEEAVPAWQHRWRQP